MNVVATKTLNAYRQCYPKADSALRAWAAFIKRNNYEHFADLKKHFPSADLIRKDRIVFNIKGNNFRLICAVNFNKQAVFVKWFGTHKEYDKINPSR